MRTIFGISESLYKEIRMHGTPEENEALDILECEWAERCEREENGIKEKVLDWDYVSHENDWVLDPQ